VRLFFDGGDEVAEVEAALAAGEKHVLQSLLEWVSADALAQRVKKKRLLARDTADRCRIAASRGQEFAPAPGE